MMFNKIKILILILFLSCTLFSQESKSRKYFVKGNKEYLKLSYDEAAADYLRAIQEGGNSYKSNFNLGNAMYRLKKYDEAISQYKKSTKLATNKSEEADAYFNIGDSYYKKKDYEQAAEAFKKALKLNPKDNKARYNYALAKQKLKDQDKEEKENKKDNSKKNSKQNQKNNFQQENQPDKQQNQGSQQENDQQGKSGGNGDNEKAGQGGGQRQGNQKINNNNLQSDEKSKSEKDLEGQRQFYEGILGSMEEQEKRAQQKIINKKIPQSQSIKGKDW